MITVSILSNTIWIFICSIQSIQFRVGSDIKCNHAAVLQACWNITFVKLGVPYMQVSSEMHIASANVKLYRLYTSYMIKAKVKLSKQSSKGSRSAHLYFLSI